MKMDAEQALFIGRHLAETTAILTLLRGYWTCGYYTDPFEVYISNSHGETHKCEDLTILNDPLEFQIWLNEVILHEVSDILETLRSRTKRGQHDQLR